MSTKKSILLLLGISILVYYRWLLPGVFTNSDWGYASSAFLKGYFNFPSIWSLISNFGTVDLIAWRYPINFLYGVLSLFHFDSSISDRIIVFWPTLILGNIAMYFLVRKVTGSSLGGFIGSLVFNYATYFFVSQTAFLLYSGAVWSIITLLGFMLTLEKKNISLAILSGLSLFVTGAYDFRMAYISVFLLTGYFIYWTVFLQREKPIKVFIHNGLLLFLIFFIFGLLNSYWVIPLVLSKKFASNIILQRGLFGNEFLNITYAITLSHPFWTGGQLAVFHPQTILVYFWIIPILAFFGLYLGRFRKNIVFFGLVAFVGIFLTKQVGQPFSGVYIYLFEHLPGFSAFREATKFYFLVALGFSILIGEFVSVILSKYSFSGKKIFKYFLLLSLTILFVSNGVPFIKEDLGMSVPHTEPQDYVSLNKFILSEKEFSRTLWVPAFSRWGPSDSTHTVLSGVDTINNEWSNLFVVDNDSHIADGGTLLMESLDKSFSRRLLSNSSIKFVILPLEDISNDDDFFVFYGENRNYYAEELSKTPYLKRINANTGKIVVYENQSARPHIYSTLKKETIYADIPYQKVNFTYINPTTYTINLKNISKPFYLNFTDSYNPNWELHIGNVSWMEPLYRTNYFLSVKHFANDAGLNSFYVDPHQICSTSQNCTKNKDGSYSMNVTLYFEPQSYVYMGLIIGGITLIGVSGYLSFVGYAFLKRKYEKRN